VSAGLSVKEENILTLKLKLTLFFLSVGLSTNALLWPFLHMLQRRTSSNSCSRGAQALTLFFLSVSLSTNALLWPFLHMLQRRTSSNSCSRGAQALTLFFLSVGLSTHALLWPFLHMLQRRTSSNSNSLCFFVCAPPAQVQLFFEVLKYELL
jgi:prepilin signal peptidase PulO-like enzyme (type II secretory pathway)